MGRSELKGVRDVREASRLGFLLSELGKGRTAQCADILAMRLRELRLAKKDGGSWERASVPSLLPTTHPANAPLADGAFVL